MLRCEESMPHAPCTNKSFHSGQSLAGRISKFLTVFEMCLTSISVGVMVLSRHGCNCYNVTNFNCRIVFDLLVTWVVRRGFANTDIIKDNPMLMQGSHFFPQEIRFSIFYRLFLDWNNFSHFTKFSSGSGTCSGKNICTVYVVNEVHASIKAHPFLQLIYWSFYHRSLDLGS